MSTYLGYISIFLLGGIIGAAMMHEFGKRDIFFVEEEFDDFEEDNTVEVDKEAQKYFDQSSLAEYLKPNITDLSESVNNKTDEMAPFIIDDEEYGQDGREGQQLYYYRSGELTFYDPDINCLAIKEEGETLVGLYSLDLFGDEPEDGEEVFVRNPELKTDYHIIYVDEDYEEDR